MKRGQMKLSFGMIFSIILIIIFIAFAFYAINKFLGFQKNISVEKFVSDLQSDITKVYKGEQATVSVSYDVPVDVLKVCFEDDDNIAEELSIRYEKKIDRRDLEHINIIETTMDDNPFCIEGDDGKINLLLEKDFGESTVTILEQS